MNGVIREGLKVVLLETLHWQGTNESLVCVPSQALGKIVSCAFTKNAIRRVMPGVKFERHRHPDPDFFFGIHGKFGTELPGYLKVLEA